jgi:hypothetical protein
VIISLDEFQIKVEIVGGDFHSIPNGSWKVFFPRQNRSCIRSTSLTNLDFSIEATDFSYL